LTAIVAIGADAVVMVAVIVAVDRKCVAGFGSHIVTVMPDPDRVIGVVMVTIATDSKNERKKDLRLTAVPSNM
jgi:hypothetical protein